MNDKLQFKSADARVEVKAVDTNGILTVRAYALAFGNVDSWGDIIMPNACDAFLASKDADRMALCWQHERQTVIGKIIDKGVDDYGMWIEAEVLPTTAGKDAAILLKAGAVKEFSIGYSADSFHYEKREGYPYEIRILDAITIYECSPVTIAANPDAIVVSAKADGRTYPEPEPAPDPEPETETKNEKQTETTMTPEEIKAMMAEAEAKAANDRKGLQEKLDAAEKTIGEQKTAIDNLDVTVKDQQKAIEELKAKRAEVKKTFFSEFKAAIESRRDELQKMLERKEGRMHLEFKADVTTADITALAYGAQLEPGVNAARIPVNAFYDNLIKETVEADRVNWLEGAFTDAADYVAELTAAADDDVEVVEKSRLFAKVGAHLRVSSEVVDWFTTVYNWARTTAYRKVLQKVDTEICAGNGSDASQPKHIYGLKGAATAFTATGAHYGANATIADVILDAQAQAQAAGFNIDKVFVTWAEMAEIRGLKSTTGNYLFDEVRGILNGVQIIPTSKLSTGELLAVDSNAVRIKERPTYEIEVARNAQLDGWDVYVRKAVQNLVKEFDKPGVIYVASVATAITAIQ